MNPAEHVRPNLLLITADDTHRGALRAFRNRIPRPAQEDDISAEIGGG